MSKKKVSPFIKNKDEDDERVPARVVRPVRRMPEEIEEEAFDSTEEMLANLAEEYGSGELRIEVFLVNDKSNELQRVGKYNYPGEFDPDVVAEKFGGGKYRYLVKDEHGTIRKKFTINFAKPVGPVGAAVGLDYNAKILDMMEKRIAENESKAKDNVSQLTSIFQMMLAMTEKSNATVLQLLQGRKDPLEDILKYKQLFGSDDAVNKVEKLMGVLMSGAKLGEQFSDKGESGGGMLEQIISGVAAAIAGKAAGGQGGIGNALQQVRDVMTDGRGAPGQSALSAGPAKNPPAPEPLQDPGTVASDDITGGLEPPPAEEPESISEYVLDMVGENVALLKMQSEHVSPVAAAKMLSGIFNKDGVAWDVNAYFRAKGTSEIVASFPELKVIEPWLAGTVAEYIKLFEPKMPPVTPKPVPVEQVKKELANNGAVHDDAGSADPAADRGSDAGAGPEVGA